jgi:hypothetical protein
MSEYLMVDVTTEQLFKEEGIGIVGIKTMGSLEFPYILPSVLYPQYLLSIDQISKGLETITFLNKEGISLSLPLRIIKEIILFYIPNTYIYGILWSQS